MLRLTLLLLCCLVCTAVCQDENVLLFGVCSDGTVRTITPSSGYAVSDPYSPPQPQSLISSNFVTQLAVDPVGKLGFVPQTLRGQTGGSFDPRNYSLAVFGLDTDRQTGNNVLQTTLALPWANTYQSPATFNVFWEASEGVVLVANALDASSPYQLWSVAPSTGALTQLFEWPALYGFQAGAGAYNQTSQQLYLLQTRPGLAVTTFDLTTLANTSVPVGTTESVHALTVLGLGLAFDSLHAVFTWSVEDSSDNLVTTVHYGLLDPRTGLLTSIAQLDDSLFPSLTSCTVTVAEGTNQLYLTTVDPNTNAFDGPSSALLVLQLFTGRVLRVLDLWNAPDSTTFYASAALSTSPSPLVSFNALAGSADGQSLTIAPLDDGWLLATSSSLAKLDANGSAVWRLPFSSLAGFISDSTTGLAVGNKGRTAFFGSSPATLNSPAQLSVVDVSTSSTPSLLTVPSSFPVPSNSQASYFRVMVSAAASQPVAVFGNNLGVFAKDCGNPCTGYVAATLSFCAAQLTCTTVVLNATSLFTQALSDNGAYFFYGTNSFIAVYSAFPQTIFLTSWNPLALGLPGIATSVAASYSGSLAVFGFSSGNLVFLTSPSSGKFQPTVFPARPLTWIPQSVACTETAVVAAFQSESGAAYNISFYRSAAQGTVPQLVASYCPFPGVSPKGYSSSPITTAITSNGRYAIVGGLQSLGSNLWIFDLNTIDAQQLTIQPPVNGFLPGSILQLRLLDSSGRLGVATTASSNPNTSRNFAFGFDL